MKGDFIFFFRFTHKGKKMSIALLNKKKTSIHVVLLSNVMTKANIITFWNNLSIYLNKLKNEIDTV